MICIRKATKSNYLAYYGISIENSISGMTVDNKKQIECENVLIIRVRKFYISSLVTFCIKESKHSLRRGNLLNSPNYRGQFV